MAEHFGMTDNRYLQSSVPRKSLARLASDGPGYYTLQTSV